MNYGCPKCRKEAELPQIQKGKDGHAHMIHGMASAATVAWIMYQKYFNGMPLYRQEQDWKQCGANISRTTFANWMIANAQDFFRPMYEYLHKKLLARSFAMADETPVQVLNEPGRRAQTNSYMCCSAVEKTENHQSSSTSIRRRGLGTMRRNSWKGSLDI